MGNQSKGHVVEGRIAASPAAPTSEETNAILRDIRSELIELNTELKDIIEFENTHSKTLRLAMKNATSLHVVE